MATLLLYLPFSLLALFLCVTSSTDMPLPSLPAPDVRLEGNYHALSQRGVGFPRDSRTHADVRVPDPKRYSEKLELVLVRSATSWLEIRWQLTNRTGFLVGHPQFSRVRCHIGNTTILHTIWGSRSQYRVPNLASNTEYLLCVEVLEDTDLATPDFLLFKCDRFRTIPLVRPDSIVGLVLTFGYIFLMALMGYVTWWMRVRRHAAEHRDEDEDEDEMELTHRTSQGNRFSEIEERTHLNSNTFQTTEIS